ncbi:hypothetical protein [Tenacibaculum finnmarkense]|uniref:Uncharacterized protein n=1 Tax=Tenacibaculum finnmarkense genomovar ulcerans TaxID=2781388 RepID=A0A2I2MAN8_9FLAO|nr:hypothetical protein [Tenacibaculum finnmarkense]MBE7697306.1 hypothetical protein [Tenacibaculum finnmarkense genomovar ulcerans]MCD8433134.1 hypothetical protein [Tenacibaculum finnmarkense genomovar ulcerans]MCD8445789.1 hypothetical protein [Tenacibaculum finnmarkense genomovar finnmarkense]WCC44275.1 hypothetical protein PJW08_10945 [Tenacibaculum finnmarkense]WCC46450.1 hypothetical protein PJH08_08650 [Tenacibaculum finnmarkense]
MTYKIISAQKKQFLITYFYLIILSILCNSCNYKTEKTIGKTTKQLANGSVLSIQKTNKETTSIGIFTKHNYGTSHSFSYSFFIRKKNINWNGASAEPKNILFYKDSIYLRSLKEKSIKTQYLDSTNNTINYKYHLEIQEFFEKYIDNRYFFKLLGDDYWIEITSKHYNEIKKQTTEYSIPNDNEFRLKLPKK